MFVVKLRCRFGSFGRFERSERQISRVRLRLYNWKQNKSFFRTKSFEVGNSDFY